MNALRAVLGAVALVPNCDPDVARRYLGAR